MELSFPRLSPPQIRNALYLLAYLTQIVSYIVSPSGYTIFSLTFLTARWLSVYVYHTGILNRFIPNRRYDGLLLGTVLAMVLFIGLRYTFEEILLPLTIGYRNYDPGTTLIEYAQDNRYYAMLSVGLGLLFKVIEDWFLHQQERQNLVNERNTAELAFLKSQVNPHFLFNTLNNIYALAYTKSDAAPGAILKLSDLMRYMLYDSNGAAGKSQKVSLSKEITYLENLIELEKLRVAGAQVHFQSEGNADLYRIEPLLLITFVENAFKHGDLNDPAHPLTILLTIRQGKLTFITKNKKSNRQKDSVGGIGLQNVKRRLALLYPEQHTLRISDENGMYVCHLEIQL